MAQLMKLEGGLLYTSTGACDVVDTFNYTISDGFETDTAAVEVTVAPGAATGFDLTIPASQCASYCEVTRLDK